MAGVTRAHNWRQASEVSDAARTWRVEADVIVRSTAVASLASGLQWARALRDAAAVVKERVTNMSPAIASTVLGCCVSNWEARFLSEVVVQFRASVGVTKQAWCQPRQLWNSVMFARLLP